MDKINFKDGDKDCFIYVKKPGAKEKLESKLYANKIFSEIYKSKSVVLRQNLTSHLREIGLWDDERENLLEKLNKEIDELELVFRKGGIGKNAAKEKAIELRVKRDTRTYLLADTYRLDSRTLEGQIENAEFDSLAASCILNDEGKRLFATVDEYLENSEKEHISSAASKLAGIVYELNEDYKSSFPENKFLKEFGFVDEKLRLVNTDKKLVDSKGRLVDENGRLINENGELIDGEGKLVDDTGRTKEEFIPFIDD